ncbi:hypothetical protein [Sinomonas humi]|uniref:Uncharacterized protein n=1 Tax=Sinomonas humi TaxID=1338436 RepID=A0A0B2ARM7_9MICC|nr:hypothetical protein [Sinomonas humi]KHL04508.1 hypothetical protein LK10_04745 [Sinomonas humi]
MIQLIDRVVLGPSASTTAERAEELRGERMGEADELREVARLALEMAVRRYRENSATSPRACA